MPNLYSRLVNAPTYKNGSRAEFYNLPGIALFDNMADLKQKINTLDTIDQSRVMRNA